MGNVMEQIAGFIGGGLQSKDKTAKDLLEALFGERYHKRHYARTAIRDAYKLSGTEDDDQGVPFAGLINPDNPPTGPYGGTSLVWFPTDEHGSLIGLGVGTRGLSPDEGILTRPGHTRRVVALRRMLAKLGVETWTKPNPANINIQIPRSAVERFPGFEKALKRYGHEMYCMAVVTQSIPQETSLEVVRAFFDLYSYERGWETMAAYKDERNELIGRLRKDLFEGITTDLIYERLLARHFVILQGPPGTGKTRIAGKVMEDHFNGIGKTIQFHPAVTYEDFVIGLSPDINKENTLRFDVRYGSLVEASKAAAEAPYLLVIDEINRADLGKILGEAIYLFEPDDIGKRSVDISHPIDGETILKLPLNLYVLGTMNTADRSIANLDLAIRRRFSIITMMPDQEVVSQQKLQLATEFFNRICDVFIEHAPQDSLNLLPGHSYFLAKDEGELKKRFRYELLPLLDEYLKEGYLGPAATELNAVRDAIADAVI